MLKNYKVAINDIMQAEKIFNLYYNIKKQTPLFTKYSLYTLSSNSNFSNEKAKKELEYKNRDMKDTIKDTIKWLKRMNYIK